MSETLFSGPWGASWAYGFFTSIGIFTALYFFCRRAAVVVYPMQRVLLTQFGACTEELKEPGLYFRPSLWIPGYSRIDVSAQLDFERVQDLHVTDRDGTTLRVDLWIEFQITDARQSVYAVESWRDALRNLLLHSLMASAGSRHFDQISSDRAGLAQEILAEARQQAAAWGLRVSQLWIQDIRLLPEIAKRFSDRVAAQLEMEKARLEEEGRTRVHLLQAATEKQIAELHAEARAMHPRAVGNAYRQLGKNPKALEAFETLYRLSMLPAGKVVSFLGFGDGAVRPLDALMIPDDVVPQNSLKGRSPSSNHSF